LNYKVPVNVYWGDQTHDLWY